METVTFSMCTTNLPEKCQKNYLNKIKGEEVTRHISVLEKRRTDDVEEVLP